MTRQGFATALVAGGIIGLALIGAYLAIKDTTPVGRPYPRVDPAVAPEGSEYRYQAKDGRWIHCLVLREQGHTIGSHCWWEP